MRDWINISVKELEDIVSIAPYSQFHQMLLAIKKNDLHKAVLYEVSPGMATEIYNTIYENAESVMSRMPDSEVSTGHDHSLPDADKENADLERAEENSDFIFEDSTDTVVSVIDLGPDDSEREYIETPDEQEDENSDGEQSKFDVADETQDPSENDLIIRSEKDDPPVEIENTIGEENVENKVLVHEEDDITSAHEDEEKEYIPPLQLEENEWEETNGEEDKGEDAIAEDMPSNESEEEEELISAPEDFSAYHAEKNEEDVDSNTDVEYKEEESSSENEDETDRIPEDGNHEDIEEIVIEHPFESESDVPQPTGKKEKGKSPKKDKKKKKAGKRDKEQEDYLSDFSKWLLSKTGSTDEHTRPVFEKSIKKDKKKKKKKKKKTEFFSGKDSGLVSEPLAELLANQGHAEDAIEMYEKLSLIFPEKSVYFAAKIEKIKNKN